MLRNLMFGVSIFINANAKDLRSNVQTLSSIICVHLCPSVFIGVQK
jgi:hypothetical protein